MTGDYVVKATPSGENTYLEKQEIEFVNEAPPIFDGGAHDKDIVFINDWSSLEWAVNHLVNEELYEHTYGPSGLSDTTYEAIDVISHYVPRLLTQYASLLETSLLLTEGWEQYAALHPPTGLHLPVH